LPCYLLGLISNLPGCLLSFLSRLLCELLHLLQGLLGSLIHYILDASILSRLSHRVLKLYVGVDQLLDLGLLVALWELLSVLLQLLTIVLGLALDPAQRLPVEVLGLLHGLLLHLLLKVLSLISQLLSFSRLLPLTDSVRPGRFAYILAHHFLPWPWALPAASPLARWG
jgi:hypothetical protein